VSTSGEYSLTAVLNSTGAKVFWGRMLTGAKKYDGVKVPIHFRSWNESYLERKFPGMKVLRSESECSLLGTFAPGSESTEGRKGHNLFTCRAHLANCAFDQMRNTSDQMCAFNQLTYTC